MCKMAGTRFSARGLLNSFFNSYKRNLIQIKNFSALFIFSDYISYTFFFWQRHKRCRLRSELCRNRAVDFLLPSLLFLPPDSWFPSSFLVSIRRVLLSPFISFDRCIRARLSPSYGLYAETLSTDSFHKFAFD